MTKTIMSSADIDLAIQRISLQIMEHHEDTDNLAIVGIYTCGVYLAKRIHTFMETHLGKKLDYGSLDINLYRDDWSLVSQNPVVKMTDLPFDVDNKKIILVDDVIYTGRTIRAAMDAIMDYGRAEVIQLVALVDRGGRELPIQPDYVGMKVSIDRHQKINVVMEYCGLDTASGCGEVMIEG